MYIRTVRKYNYIWSLYDRLEALEESGRLNELDLHWVTRQREKLYKALEEYNLRSNYGKSPDEV